MIVSNVAVLDIGLVNALIQMEVVDLEGILPVQGMVVALVDVVIALEDQIVLLAMMMIDMMVGAMWTAGILIMVLGAIAMHRQQNAILVTGTVVQIVMRPAALPGKGAMREMEAGPLELTTVMTRGALVAMAEVVHVAAAAGLLLNAVGIHCFCPPTRSTAGRPGRFLRRTGLPASGAAPGGAALCVSPVNQSS